MKTDILFIAAHPDDVELCCAGTVMKHVDAGKIVGIIDLTHGELGTRGSGELRLKEAEAASKIMGIHARENLGLPDGFFDLSKEMKMPIIEMIRKYQPEIVITNAVHDRHPDHGRAAKLVAESCFLSGLRKIETRDTSGNLQESWRPRHVYHMIQDRYIHPNICVDITAYMDRKVEAIMAYRSQFYDAASAEPITPISRSDFFEFWKSRFREMGRLINVEFAEGFTSELPVRKDDLLS